MTTRRQRAALSRPLLAAFLLLSACAIREPRHPGGLRPPPAIVAPAPPAPPAVSHPIAPPPPPSSLREEPLPAEPAVPEPAAEPGTAAAPPAGALPSPLATIDRSTPPQVAAATRLTEQGRLQLESGDPDAALEHFERAIAVDPTNPYAYYFLGWVHLQRGDYEQAITFADRAAVLSSRSDPAWLARACALQGQVYEAAGRFADARDAYQRALRANPRDGSALAGLGRVGGGVGAIP